jgi:hypothetical protein
MIEYHTLNRIGLDWAWDSGQERVKVSAAAHEGEAGFASDCIVREYPL